MASFSWGKAKEQAIKDAIRYARVQAGGNAPDSLPNTDFKKVHPDWCAAATKGDFIVMDKSIKADILKKQDNQRLRDEKFVTKK